MKENQLLCIRCGVVCPDCSNSNVIKSGKTSQGKQRYFCKLCRKRFISTYSYNAYNHNLNSKIVLFTKEGLGIRSTARVLCISTTTLLKRILLIADNITKPPVPLGKTYEVDEMRSFLGNKNRLIWIVYALERRTKQVVDFNIGARSNATLFMVMGCEDLIKPKV